MPRSASLPQVVAHRGASFENAEHTLGAYVKALDAGAEGLECDVRLTADGHLVCVHDRDLRRTASRRGLVSTSNLEDLEALDFASWKSPWADLDDEAPDRDRSLDSVLTLRKLLEMVADYDRRVEVAIETKHPTRYGGLVEKRVAELLHDFGWDGPNLPEPNPVRVMSFSHTALQRMEQAGAARAAGAADRQGGVLAAAAPGHGQRTGWSGRGSPCSRRTRGWRSGSPTPATACTSGRSTPSPTCGAARSSGCRRSSPTARRTCWSCSASSVLRMAKKSRTKARETQSSTPGEVGPRQPCPCGSGKRYKACHGRRGRRRRVYVGRPFEGLPSECDIVAMRELVPSATAPLSVKGTDKPVTLCSLLPMAAPAMVRDSGQLWLGLQVQHNFGDPSRDLGGGAAARDRRRRARRPRPHRPAGRRAAAPGPGHRRAR